MLLCSFLIHFNVKRVQRKWNHMPANIIGNLSSEKRLRLTHLYGFVTATAIGLALERPSWSRSQDWIWQRNPDIHLWLLRGVVCCQKYLVLVLFAWSITLLAISLRHPRPSGRRLIRYPGFMTNAAVVVGGTILSIYHLGQTALNFRRAQHDLQALVIELPLYAGYFVWVTLLPLILCGYWKPRPVWYDRLGYLLGIIWTGIWFLNWGLTYAS